jgi:hypothetical protein
MAKIAGIELKAVKQFVGHDGYGFEATVYMDGKRIGHAFDGAYGGEIELRIDRPFDEEYTKRAAAYFAKNPTVYAENVYAQRTWLLEELLRLKEIEKVFKKNIKKGFAWTIDLRYQKRSATWDEILGDKRVKQDEIVSIVAKDSILEKVLKEHQPVEYTVFKSETDFVINL